MRSQGFYGDPGASHASGNRDPHAVVPHLGILDTASFALPNGILGSPSSYVTTVWKPKSYCEKNPKQDPSTKART